MRLDKENETAQDLARGRAVAVRCGIDWVRAEIAMTLGQFSRADGNPEAALPHLDRAAELARQCGHTFAECSAQRVRAKVHIELGHGPEALRAIAATTLLAHDDGDRTSTLAGLLTAVGAATAAGSPRVGAVLLGAIGTLSRLVGYDPLRMDPVDGQRYVESTRAALDPGEYEAALAEGRAMDMAAAIALVQRLAGRPEPAPVAGSVSTLCREGPGDRQDGPMDPVAEAEPATSPPAPARRGLSRGALGIAVVGLLVFLVGAFGGSFQGRLGEVQKNDNAAYLPATAESTKVADEQRRFSDVETVPGFVVYHRDGGLTDADKAAISADLAAVRQIDGVAPDQVAGPQFAADGTTASIAVPLIGRSGTATVNGDRLVAAEQEVLATARHGAPDGLAVHSAGVGGLLVAFLDP